MEQTEKHYHLLKYGSIFYRLTQAYFNERLKDLKYERDAIVQELGE